MALERKREETKSVRQHRSVYYAADGIEIPGVTTITRMRSSDALVGWAFKLARTYPELGSTNQYKDDLAQIGKAAHALVTAKMREVEPDLSDFTPNEVLAAQPSLEKFLRWRQGHKIEILEAGNKAFISEAYRYGGTPDLYARIDDVITVLDFKTGKSVYDEYHYQTSGYANAIEECTAIKVDQTWILCIGRQGKTVIEKVRTRDEWLIDFEWFKAMRRVYEVEKERDFIETKAEWRAENNVVSFDNRRAVREAREAAKEEVVPTAT